MYRKCKVPDFMSHLYYLDFSRYKDDHRQCEAYFWERLYKSVRHQQQSWKIYFAFLTSSFLYMFCVLYMEMWCFFIFRFVPCGMTASCVDISLCHDSLIIMLTSYLCNVLTPAWWPLQCFPPLSGLVLVCSCEFVVGPVIVSYIHSTVVTVLVLLCIDWYTEACISHIEG